MFNQVSANIAAQKQAGLFEEGAEDFVLVSQDKKGQDVAAQVAGAAGKALEEIFPFGDRSSESAP